MRNLLIIILLLGGAYFAFEQSQYSAPEVAISQPTASESRQTVGQFRSGQQVRGSGKVTRILSDDNDGSRHQRFILQLSSGQTVLIAHNIDLAPRISSLSNGDLVSFYGEFESNPQGGVIHWTHHDPQGRHVAGWLEHDGRRYQ
ncbi:MAG: DUF3465 domain-containing protein [Gammaproteobacteria bacterium]|nr:DUF3465 domain-containing protein [Gammaproteobacteria bacterium]MDH3374191.1 DUF3465 domain-containing protein [Gammaproteobacteria bacterium]MDH3409597.1 DUF3465 domain-containing protein [Gammaproteobacteria bacterium]MDH3553714.1 DUF3465 domain-containing protein [Gammaproteobacteria bacterium]